MINLPQTLKRDLDSETTSLSFLLKINLDQPIYVGTNKDRLVTYEELISTTTIEKVENNYWDFMANIILSFETKRKV